MSTLSDNERTRRVLLLCLHFTRNVTYIRSCRGLSGDFWNTVTGNSVDIAVLEWCKLFGDGRGKHNWERVVAVPERFKQGMLTDLKMSEEDFTAYVAGVRSYRDKFVAHLDDRKTMYISNFDIAISAVDLLYQHIVQNQKPDADFSGLPHSIQDYKDMCRRQAAGFLGATASSVKED